MSRPNWAFFGGKEQGARVLNALAGDGFLPAFIVLLTESSPQEVTQFEGIARQLKVKFVPEQEMSSCLGELAKLDLGLTCRFSLLKEAVFSLPRLGFLNIHSSLLPSYRGVHPVQWALVNGEEKTGVTIHQIDSGIDTGAIRLQREIRIRKEHDFPSLSEDLNRLSAEMSVEMFRFIAANNALPPVVPAKFPRSYARRRTPEDSRVDWNQPGARICNLVRAMQPPMPYAFCMEGGQEVRILRCKHGRGESSAPGQVLSLADGEYAVACADGAVCVVTDRPVDLGKILA